MMFKKMFFSAIILVGFIQFFSVHGQQLDYPPESPKWQPDSLGNQRAVLKVSKNLEEVIYTLPWRNRNVKPNQQIYVVDSTTNQLVSNLKRYQIGAEQGTIGFPVHKNKGIYYVYFLPNNLMGRPNYPNAVYPEAKAPAAEKSPKNSKGVSLLRIEAIDRFNENDPMEIIATQKEEKELQSKFPKKDYFVFPETRRTPIKMKSHLPQKWVDEQSLDHFEDEAKRGENFSFQLGIWAVKKELQGVEFEFSDLVNETGETIPADLFHSFNNGGIDYKGEPFEKNVGVGKGKIKAFWIGVPLPESLASGVYKGKVTVIGKDMEPTSLDLSLKIGKEVAANRGIDEPWNLTRLEWLNSTLAQDKTVLKPYSPVEVNGDTLSILGRKVILNERGMPGQIQSFFTEKMTTIQQTPFDLLSSPFELLLTETDQAVTTFESRPINFTERETGLVSWIVHNVSPKVEMEVKGSLEFDGYLDYQVKITAKETVDFKDIALKFTMEEGAAKYILGLGEKGGKTPSQIDWKWKVEEKNQDGMWLGNVNRGIQISLRDQHYERPLNTNFYLQKPLLLPISWGNDNKGGITINTENNQTHINAYSGEKTLKAGESEYFNFTLLLTPFHTLNTDDHWKNRYYHAYNPVEKVVESGSNVINIHHANEINPYINYPFIATKEMKDYVDRAHEAGLKVKIYNTIREVSNRLYELYPIKNLDHEIFSEGKGGGFSWLQEHLDGNYIAAWYVPQYKDAALINSGMNRWHNYYVEGMNWLVKNIGIDGIYLDDVAFDRVTMKRIKRVLTEDGKPGLIDLHSANQFNERDGFNNSAHLYMEHFPYIDRLWFGEYFDYENNSPDFYMAEVSGIPFGLMGEMLQDGGNPWRGMLYGMTNRMPYQEKKPDAIWKAWDDFGIIGSEMIGYWVEGNPIKTNHKEVLATAFVKENKVMVALASWAENPVDIQLKIDWEQLNIDPNKVEIKAPPIRDFQQARRFKLEDSIPVEKNKGWLLVIE